MSSKPVLSKVCSVLSAFSLCSLLFILPSPPSPLVPGQRWTRVRVTRGPSLACGHPVYLQIHKLLHHCRPEEWGREKGSPVFLKKRDAAVLPLSLFGRGLHQATLYKDWTSKSQIHKWSHHSSPKSCPFTLTVKTSNIRYTTGTKCACVYLCEWV